MSLTLRKHQHLSCDNWLLYGYQMLLLSHHLSPFVSADAEPPYFTLGLDFAGVAPLRNDIREYLMFDLYSLVLPLSILNKYIPGYFAYNQCLSTCLFNSAYCIMGMDP